MLNSIKNPIIDSKLQAPRIKTHVLSRRRLLDLLDRHRQQRMILLCAAAGYGKTTLLTQFLARLRRPYVYYQLEKHDADPAVFLSYLLSGLRVCRPGFGRKTMGLANLFNYPQRFFDIIAGTLVNELNAAFATGLHIILEDLHALDDAPTVCRLVDYLVQHAGPAIHFMVTTRSEPKLGLSLLKGRDEIFELNADALRFDRDEIDELLGTVLAGRLSPDDVTRIEQHSEGWPVALRFLLQDLERGAGFDRVEPWVLRTQSDLIRYFTQEIYDREPPAIREFMRKCAIPDWLSPALCDCITDRHDAAQILAGLAHRNLYLFPVAGSGYRFHNLFREFLTNKAVEYQEDKPACLRTADYYRARGQQEDALKFLIQAAEYEKAAGLISDIGDQMIGQGKSGLLHSSLERLPAGLVHGHHKLLLLRSQAYLFQGRSEEAKAACRAAIGLLKKRSGRNPDLADALYKLAGLNLNSGNFPVARRLYWSALAACPGSARQTRAAILNSYGSLLSQTGGRDRRTIADYFRTAHRLSRQTGNRALESSILNNWARRDWESGDITAAYAKFSRMIRLLKDNFTPGCGGGFFNAARLSLMLGDREETRAILDQGRALCAEYNDQWSLARINHGYALLDQESGDLKKAQLHAREALDTYQQIGVPGLTAMAYVELARISLSENRLDEAEKQMTAAWSLKGTAEDADTVPMYLLEAEIQIKRKRLKEAERTLAKGAAAARQFQAMHDLIKIDIRRTEVLYRRGDAVRAVKKLKELSRLSRQPDMERFLIRLIRSEPWVTGLLQESIAEVHDQDIRELLKILGIPTLEIRFAGIPRLLWNGAGVADSKWKTTKAKKILFYLVKRHPEPVTADHLIETFWPRASRIAGRASLRKAIQHIREALPGLDRDIVIMDKGSVAVAIGIIIRHDLDLLDRLLTRTKSGQKRPADLEKVVMKSSAGICNGWYDDWVEALRASYKKKLETGIKYIAEHCRIKKKYAAAAGWYKRLTDISPYEEAYYRALMEALVKARRSKEAVKEYERLALLLRKELNAKPQTATTALYNQIVRK